ncbi:uncharacterized protein LOC122860011 [Aphidius gifuensis]|uniref:uncharacterized protein LOC122860011 n=1 Tax=Aphidius gifuensis TaxID=684658 RepID=UPI001CDC1DC7|nr:uncharacterized protein LOC122860011 [Aphidius gifuensis]
MKPVEVVSKNIKILKQTVFESLTHCHVKIKFKLNQHVRISNHKHVFDKEYKPNWTNEIFTITKINKTSPVMYKLKDYQENPIQGSFYNEELQKVRHSDIDLIKKVLKRRGNKMYVKYLGFDNSYNQWIDNQ